MFSKVKRINILSRSMEVDMFAKVKGSDIFSTVWIPIFDKRLVSFIYFVVSIGVATYSIIVNVALVIKTSERYFVYFIAPKLMFLASYSFHFEV